MGNFLGSRQSRKVDLAVFTKIKKKRQIRVKTSIYCFCTYSGNNLICLFSVVLKQHETQSKNVQFFISSFTVLYSEYKLATLRSLPQKHIYYVKTGRIPMTASQARNNDEGRREERDAPLFFTPCFKNYLYNFDKIFQGD